MAAVGSALDRRTSLPSYSLYGDSFDSLAPRPEQLAGLDALVFDVQDVGARYYTFVWTMALCMRAAKKVDLTFFVLDRPNPLGGRTIEGPLLQPGYESFVGLCPGFPVRHGCTAGEIARIVNSEIGCDLRVIAAQGWRRDAQWESTGLPWLWPSPNMPTIDTARVYPGMCLVEGTNLSEGRGTTRPFEVSGAPFLEPNALASALEAEALPGVAFRPISFRPTFHKHAGTTCGGVFLHVTNRETFRPFRTGIAFLRAARRLGGERFSWRTERYEFVDDKPAIDLLCGGSRLRALIDADAPLEEMTGGWAEDEAAFAARRAPFLLADYG